MVKIHYQQKCQYITDNAGDNKIWLIEKIQTVVFPTEMCHLHVKWWDFKHGVLSLDSQMVHINYHLKYQEITDNAGDNKLWFLQSIHHVDFATQIGHLDDNRWDFMHGVVSLDSQMVSIHYYLKCQDITGNAGDNKPWLIQSFQIVVFATEMGHIHNKGWDFEHGVLFLDSLMVNIHYHLKYQEITDNACDNKLWLFWSIQLVVVAPEMRNLDDKGSDFEHGVLFLDWQMVNIHHHLKCQYITDNGSDNNLWLIQSIPTVVFAIANGHIDSKRWAFNPCVLSLNSQLVSIHHNLKCQEITDYEGDNKLWLFQSIQTIVFATKMGLIDDKGWYFENFVLVLDLHMVNIHCDLKCQEITDNAGNNYPLLIQKIKIVVFCNCIRSSSWQQMKLQLWCSVIRFSDGKCSLSPHMSGYFRQCTW